MASIKVMKRQTNILKVKIAGVFLALAALVYLIHPISSLAQQSNLIVSYSPTNVELKTNDEKIIQVTLSSTDQISAMDLTFQTTGSLTVVNFENSLGFDSNFDPFSVKQIAEDMTNSTSRIAYIFNSQTEDLPKKVDLYIKIKGTVTGEGKITLDYNNSQVLSSKGGLLKINPNQSAVYKLNLERSSSALVDPNILPAQVYPASTAIVNLKVKLYGVLPDAKTGLIKGTLVAVGRTGEGQYETGVQIVDFNLNGDGTLSGKAAFPDFKDGNKFSLMVKVDKYLLRRICDTSPTEEKLGGYHCTDPALTIRKGENTFDFTGMSLIPGDLGLRDGNINAYDLSIVRNNLNKNTREAVNLADLNYDGTVDQKDFEIIDFAASNTGRRADQ